MRSFHIFSFPEPLYFNIIANAMPVRFSRKTAEISADLQAETIDGNVVCAKSIQPANSRGKKYPAFAERQGLFINLPMLEGEDWVSQYYAGAGESHHFPYAGAHLGFVAVDFAFRARRFAGAVRAFFQPLFHVFHQGAAVLAQVPAVMRGRTSLS